MEAWRRRPSPSGRVGRGSGGTGRARQVVRASRGTAVCPAGTVHRAARRTCRAEDSAEHLHRQKETARGIDPSGAVEAQTSGGDDVVDVGMMLKVLSPGMEHAEEADVGSQALGIASQFEHRRRAGAVEQIVEPPLVLQEQSGEFMGQREHDVEVRHGQQLSRPRGQPLGARVPLALGTVPIAAGVERDGLMAAADALIAMTTLCRGAAADDGIEHLAMRPGKMRLLLLPKTVARSTDDVGHLEGGPAHRFISLLERFTSSVPDTSMASSGLGTACRCRRDKCRYTVVSESLACPRRTWIVRRSAPASSMWVAKQCLNV